MTDRNESPIRSKSNSGKPVADTETGDSVWKDRAAAFIEALTQIDDISWAEIARETDSEDALDFARLGRDGRRKQFEAAAAKAKANQK
ncbi:hypothetical protein [Marinobacter shengliensis]|uniref:hypothetical protein n=1 Tax=Marinobacter shengliensis TaxID=1389223 RepID=UPI0011088990|nr:hypothetical protein [Marinobacter shengliensis]